MEWINQPENVSTSNQVARCGVCWVILCVTKPCSPVACPNKAFPK